jgi:ATP synthase protein I
LKQIVEQEFRVLDDREKMAHSASAKLEADLVRRFIELGEYERTDKSKERRRKVIEDLEKQVGAKASRKMKGRREKDRSIWFGLGMFGLIGWSVAIPTLIGVAVFSWTLMLLFIGVILGCVNAWYWVKRESRRE